MGVKTNITLEELNELFCSYNFTKLTPTSSGIMDTTYIADTKNDSYILKHYERNVQSKIDADAKLLDELKSNGLHVATLIDANEGWYIYERLKGCEPKNTQTFHIQALAGFLAKMHNVTVKKSLNTEFVQNKEIDEMLGFLKTNHFYSYKKYELLKHIKFKKDGIIHGDIFKDNTVFDCKKLGVFDFSDAGDGSFAFDAGITLFGFDVDLKNKLYVNLFLKRYNQTARKKLTYKELDENMKLASEFYGLKRVFRYNFFYGKLNNKPSKR